VTGRLGIRKLSPALSPSAGISQGKHTYREIGSWSAKFDPAQLRSVANRPSTFFETCDSGEVPPSRPHRQLGLRLNGYVPIVGPSVPDVPIFNGRDARISQERLQQRSDP